MTGTDVRCANPSCGWAGRRIVDEWRRWPCPRCRGQVQRACGACTELPPLASEVARLERDLDITLKALYGANAEVLRLNNGLTPAQSVGCCLASTKEDCTRPPCPCSFGAWTERERQELIAVARKRKGRSI